VSWQQFHRGFVGLRPSSSPLGGALPAVGGPGIAMRSKSHETSGPRHRLTVFAVQV
jgi:hypothetical protein